MKQIISIKTFIVALMFFTITATFSQTLPYTFVNNSEFSDNEIYVAIVGINNGHVWVNPITGEVNSMNVSDNNIAGPVYNGEYGPGKNGLYANCFRKLSEIPNKKVNIPQIAGCRIMISFGRQLYLYFYGSSGGYSAPNLANPNDPNQNIRFEIIELTYNNNGLWCNTTRVDAYQYPMGLEVWGSDFYKKVGEFLPHNKIISLWKNEVPAKFQACLDQSNEIIQFPSKVAAFQSGGANANYLQTYIDNIWNTYQTSQLAFYAGDAGTWRGTVNNDVFTFKRDRDGEIAYIYKKPTTIEAMEGSGALATGQQWDLVVQAQICAAINRHILDPSITSGAVQNFSTTSNFYQTEPYNWYCKFWHRSDITHDGLTYSFCYDDVFDQSATIHTSSPQNITITIGGFSDIDNGNNNNDDNEVGVTGLGGTYYIQNKNSGLVMDVYYGGTDNGINILQYINGGTSNQQFTLHEVSNGMYYIMNENSGKVIDVAEASTNDFANIQQYTFNSSNNQYFKALSTGDGYYKFKAVHSGKIIEVANASTEENANISQYTDHNQVCGQWALVPVSSSSWFTQIEAENYSEQSGVQKEDCAEGGQNTSYIDTGDWMKYSNIELPYSGTYTFNYRVSSESTGGKLILDHKSGAVILDEVTIPVTEAWQTYTTVSSSVNIEAGTYNLGIYAQSGGWNLNWFSIRYSGLKSTVESSTMTNIGEKFNIFPNPVADQIYVSGADSHSKLEIFTITGSLVKKGTGTSVNISSLLRGTYVIRIKNGDTSEYRKFVKK